MKIFGTGRGCFMSFNADVSGSKGAILSLGAAGQIPDAAGKMGLIITDVGLQQNEIVAHLRCFNNAIYTYAFGAGLGDCTVRFMAFLNKGHAVQSSGGANDAGLEGAMGFSKVLDMYAKSRLSKSKEYAKLAIGSAGDLVKGQVVSLTSNTNNTEGNIQDFTLSLKLTEIQEGGVQ